MQNSVAQGLADRLSPLMGNRLQWGFVVRDLEAAMRFWTEVMNVGPFIHIAELADVECRHRGALSDVQQVNAFSYYGDVQIEIIQQINDAPSPYTEFLASGREGFQHLGFWVDDPVEKLTKLEAGGCQAVYSARLLGAEHPSIYCEAPGLGVMLEVSHATAQKAQLYAAMAELVRDWDGSRPVRRYRTMLDFAQEQGVPTWSKVPSAREETQAL